MFWFYICLCMFMHVLLKKLGCYNIWVVHGFVEVSSCWLDGLYSLILVMSISFPLISWTLLSFSTVENNNPCYSNVYWAVKRRNRKTVTVLTSCWDLMPKTYLIYPMWHNLKAEKLLLNMFSPLICIHVWVLEPLSSFFIQPSASLVIKLQSYLSSISQKIHRHLCVTPCYYQWQLFPSHYPWGFLPITPSLVEAILKSLESLKWNSWQFQAAVDLKWGCGEVFQECYQCLGQWSQRLTRSQLGFWTAELNNNVLSGLYDVCYHFLL